MWWHTRRNQISSFARNKRVHLNRPVVGGASVQSTAGSRGVRISGSNAGYTMFRGSVKSNGYPLQSPVSPPLPLSCVTVCCHNSTGLYFLRFSSVSHHRYSYELNIRSQRLSVKQFQIHRPIKFELFTALKSRTAVFRFDTLCQRFWRAYYLQFQGRFCQVIRFLKPEDNYMNLEN